MDDRTLCLVPFCRRTASAKLMGGAAQFLCGKHYPLVDKRIRRLRARVKRKVRKTGWTVALARLDDRLWDRAKQQALDRAGALGKSCDVC